MLVLSKHFLHLKRAFPLITVCVCCGGNFHFSCPHLISFFCLWSQQFATWVDRWIFQFLLLPVWIHFVIRRCSSLTVWAASLFDASASRVSCRAFSALIIYLPRHSWLIFIWITCNFSLFSGLLDIHLRLFRYSIIMGHRHCIHLWTRFTLCEKKSRRVFISSEC